MAIRKQIFKSSMVTHRVKSEELPHFYCVICDSALEFDRTLYDDRYGYPEEFELYLCKHCGHRILNVNFSSSELSELYTFYYPRSHLSLESFRSRKEVHGFFSWFNGESRFAYSWVPKNVTVLDIGCGFGETLAYHQARGCDVYGVEADNNIKRVADKYGFNVHIGLFDSNLYEPNFFDYVTLDQVVEHFKYPTDTLHGIARILKPGGLAILSTPNSYGWGAGVFGHRWINWHAPYHIQHFSRESMGIAAKKAGLSLERVSTVTSSDWLHFQWNHLLHFPRRGEPSQFWLPGTKSLVWKKLIRISFGLIHHLKFNHVLTRLFDSLDVGDNNLFFLRKL